MRPKQCPLPISEHLSPAGDCCFDSFELVIHRPKIDALQLVEASMTKPVVTRFAPSPTGYLHIGGARTALFNWLYAKHTGGKFLLRVEDTDRERSTDAATKAIIDGLDWLGLRWDDQTVFQSQRGARHAEIAREILARGQAYLCYLTPAELETMQKAITAERELAKQEKRAPRGPQKVESPWRDRDPREAPAGVKPAIRLKAPREGETVVADLVQGRVVFQNSQLDDMIILRSDDTPVYNLAVVVDDHDMGVTHVIRGNDHLNNAARQTLLYKAMGWDVPVFAHIPLIHGADGAKLSKRHGAQAVEDYRAMGYLPAGIRNYIARLGWSHGDDEIFTTDQAIQWFDVKDINKSAARFDFAKLADVNGHYVRQASVPELIGHLDACLTSIGTLDAMTTGLDPKAPPRPDVTLMREVAAVRPELETGADVLAALKAAGTDRVAAAIPSLKERAKTLPELAQGMLYLLAKRPLKADEKAAKVLGTEAKQLIGVLLPKLEAVAEWQAGALEAAVKAHAEAGNIKLGNLAQPLRAALTGKTVSPPVFDVMAVLGRDEALARLRDQAG